MIPHGANLLPVLLFAESGDRHIADRRFEFDQRVSTVVAISREGLAFCAEVGIVADRAFVPISDDIALVVLA